MSLELDQLQQQVRDLHSRLELSEARSRRERRRLRITTGLAFAALVGAMVISPGSRTAIAQGYGVTLQQLAARLTAVENKDTQQDAALARLKDRADNLEQRAVTQEVKTHFLSADINGQTTTFSGCNLYVQNGLGATNGNFGVPGINGLGNLIIGYNCLAVGLDDRVHGLYHRTGSHNLVMGTGNEYTSFGGIVAGYCNTIASDYATVTGGELNTANGFVSSISGGANLLQSNMNGWSAGGYH